MLERTNAVKSLKEKMDRIELRLAEQEKTQKEQQQQFMESLKEVKDNLLSLRDFKQDYVKKFSEDLKGVKVLEKEFQKALRSFHQNHKQLYDSVYKRLHNEVSEKTYPLKEAVEKLTGLDPEARKIKDMLSTTKDEMAKLNEISSRIKKEDFELKHYAKELLKMDSEKLKLMKKIESLKKIIAYERRNRR